MSESYNHSSHAALNRLNDLGRRVRAWPPWIRYATGIAITLIPVLIRIILEDPFIGTRFPLVVFCPGIFAAAWLGGIGPGLAATTASVLWADYLCFEHAYTFYVQDISEAIALVFLAITGGLICCLVEMFVQAQLLADRSTSESGERATYLALAVREAQSAQAEAENANEIKDQFLAMVSHELRSPLQAIIGAVQILRKKFWTRESETFLTLIERNARLETRLVQDLVDMSRISTGKLEANLQPTNLRPIIEIVIGSMQPTLDEKRISLRWKKLGVDRTVLGDPERLQQIISNLLGNAVKFTNSGGWIDVCLDGESSSYVQLRVSDSGIGMDKELLADAFTPFRQGEIARHQSGLGLGLAIVKNLVELHRGTIEARSEGIGKGSTFVVHLPVEAVTRHFTQSAP